MTARAELSSLSTSIDELVGHLSRITDELSGAERDLLGPDLFEVERALRSARRRLGRMLDASAGG
jgi:hypothetical protein